MAKMGRPCKDTLDAVLDKVSDRILDLQVRLREHFKVIRDTWQELIQAQLALGQIRAAAT